jgi:hypothetical protein
MGAHEPRQQPSGTVATTRRPGVDGVAANWAIAALVAGVTLAGGGCASPAKRAAAPAERAQVAPQTVTLAPAPTPPTVENPVAAPVRTNEPVVIEEGGSASGEQSLVAAAAAERERRRTAPPPTLVVNDKNLAEHATGKLTVSQGSGAAAAPTTAARQTEAPVKDEQYWRDRVRGLRERWGAAVDSIGELEAKASSLRTRFYAQDDPYIRDGEIKPAWDKSLEDLDEARHRARSLEDQLAVALEEGRQGGALPGWLRDGIELEPSERPYERPERPVMRDDANLVREPEELGQPPQR